jgi:hypothetical protein
LNDFKIKTNQEKTSKRREKNNEILSKTFIKSFFQRKLNLLKNDQELNKHIQIRRK